VFVGKDFPENVTWELQLRASLAASVIFYLARNSTLVNAMAAGGKQQEATTQRLQWKSMM